MFYKILHLYIFSEYSVHRQVIIYFQTKKRQGWSTLKLILILDKLFLFFLIYDLALKIHIILKLQRANLFSGSV